MRTFDEEKDATENSVFRPRRREVNQSQWGVAAPCTSEQFKTRDHKQKPLARCWDHRLSPESASRTGSSLKAAFKHLKNDNVISLGGGLPPSDYFPFETMELTVPPLESLREHNLGSNNNLVGLHASKHDILLGHSVYDITVALNYSQGSGSAQFLRWITEHVEMVHNPPYSDWQCTMSIGNTSALDMAFRMLSRPGDYILSDDYTFATAVETAIPIGVKFMGVDMDDEGILPESLAYTLESWDSVAHGGARKPFLLYTVPTGQNPTGATQSLQRRQEIYRVAQTHDLIILEDDPYYFLQMDPFVTSRENNHSSKNTQSPGELLKAIIPSYLSLDLDGRVIRMDSFSKVISPGVRLGWITAPQEIVERYKHHADVSTQGPSGLSQLALFKLLDEHWGHSGYFERLLHIRREYTKRRDYALDVCDRYLPKDIVSWKPCQAGMFQWLKIDWHKHPNAGSKSMIEIEEEIWLESIKQGTLVARGSWFYATVDRPHDDMFYRITFAAATMDKIGEAVMRFGKALRGSFRIG